MEPIPEKTFRFLEQNIDSVDQLELLRLLATDRDKEWSCATLAQAAQTHPHTIARHLEILERRGLVGVVRQPDVTYRYGVRSPAVDSELTFLLRLYNERPVSIIRLIYTRNQSTWCRFAEALRLRKED